MQAQDVLGWISTGLTLLAVALLCGWVVIHWWKGD